MDIVPDADIKPVPVEYFPEIPCIDKSQLELELLERVADTNFYRAHSRVHNCTYLIFDVHQDTSEFLLDNPPEQADPALIGQINVNVIHAHVRQAMQHRREHRTNYATELLIHDHIMPPLIFLMDHDKGRIDEVIYENAPDGCIRDFISVHPAIFNDIQVLKWGYQLISAIKYCHDDLNIIHRAISPITVFVYQQGGIYIVKLGGFSLARTESTDPMTASNGKYIHFTAPEMLTDEPIAYYFKAADIWSFGMLLYYMSHGGRDLFDGLRRRQPLRKHLLSGQRPPLRNEIDQNLSEIITSCWEREALLKRPSAKNLLQHFNRI